VTIGTPLHQTNNGFFEQIGGNFNAQGQNWFFHENLGGAPAFGGATPGAGLNTGFGFQFPGGSGSFNLFAGQGSTSSMTSVAPSVTVMNGATGAVFSGSQTPFVIGVIPVVGERSLPPPAPWSGNPLQERLSRMREAGAASAGIREGSPAQRALAERQAQNAEQAGQQAGAGQRARSSPKANAEAVASAQFGGGDSGGAGSGAARQSAPASVAELKAMRAAAEAATESAEQREAERLAARAGEAEAAGKPAVARIYYQQAARRATGPLKEEWAARATALGTSAQSTKPAQSHRGGQSASEAPPSAP
jgi:hypothetical protein